MVENWVCIPYLNRHDMTAPLVESLIQQGSFEKILLFDNGSTDIETIAWQNSLSRHDAIVFDAAGWNLHQMWNRGIEHAEEQSGKSFNIAILNNDIQIGPHFLDSLSKALRRREDIVVACPNWDGRESSEDTYIKGIAYNKGLSGWAFMVKGEWNWRFPEELQFYCGDRYMMWVVEQQRKKAVMTMDTSVQHINGGSQTAGPSSKNAIWDEDKRVLAQIQARYRRTK